MKSRGIGSLDGPRVGVPLVPAHHQPADLLADVDEVVGVAQRREVGAHALDRPRDQVLMLHRHDRHLDARKASELVRPDPAGVHDDLGLDRAVVGHDPRSRGRREPSISSTRTSVRTRAPRAFAPAAKRQA